jgi:hypothetical protein
VGRARILLCCCALLLSGCFFHTRDPEPPVIGGGCEVDFLFNDSYEAVIHNLEGALLCGDTSEYLDVISADFLYVPTPLLETNYPNAFAQPWTKVQERNFIESTFRDARFDAALADSILSGPTEDGNLIRLTVEYLIKEVDALGNELGPRYDDTADLVFIREGLYVRLLEWRDTGAGSLPFGDRRGSQGGGL